MERQSEMEHRQYSARGLSGVLPLVTLYLIKMAVDSVVRLHGQTIFGVNSVVFSIGLLGTATLLEAVSTSTDRIVSLIQGGLLTGRMYHMLHTKSAEVDLEYYESANYYDALLRAQQTVPIRPTRVLANLRQLVQNGISVMAQRQTRRSPTAKLNMFCF
jgi:ATP-binding cassette subfamily B protein